MTGQGDSLRFLLDESVPNAVGVVLKGAGHETYFVNKSQIVLRGSPDPVVAEAAVQADAILVALDGDMRQIAKSHGAGKNRYSKLSVLKLSCSELAAAKRVKAMMSLIEHEWAIVHGGIRKFHVEIKDTLVRSMR